MVHGKNDNSLVCSHLVSINYLMNIKRMSENYYYCRRINIHDCLSRNYVSDVLYYRDIWSLHFDISDTESLKI